MRASPSWCCLGVLILALGCESPGEGGAIDASPGDGGSRSIDAETVERDAAARDAGDAGGELGPPSPPLVLEAELGALAGAATRWPADRTAGEVVVFGASGEGSVEVPFRADGAQALEIWLRVRAPTASYNSVFVTLDDEPVVDANTWDIPVTPVLRWYRMHRRGETGTHTRAEGAASFVPSAGAHTLRISAREPRVELDAIFIGTGEPPPSRLAEPPTRAITHSLTDFGAAGDGTTDDSDALAAALAALSPGDALHIPAGRYRFTRSLSVRTPDVTIAGEGSATILLADLPSTGSGAALSFLGASDTSPPSPLLADAEFLDREIHVPADAPYEVGELIHIESDDWGPVAPANANDPGGLFFRDRVNFARVMAARDEGGQRVLTLDRPLFSLFAASRSRVRSYTPISGVVLRDLRMDAPDRTPASENGRRNLVTCSRCEGSFFVGVELRHAFFSALGIGHSFDTHVIDVHARDAVDTTTPGAGYGVTLAYSQAVVVRDSLFSGVMRHGIPIGAANRECLILRTRHPREVHEANIAAIDIHGRDNYANLVEDNEMIGGSQGIIVGGGGSSWGNDGAWNVIRGNRISGTTTWGISVHKQTYDTVIEDNVIDGGPTGILIQTGSDRAYVQGNRLTNFSVAALEIRDVDQAWVRDNVCVPRAGAAASIRVTSAPRYEIVDNALGGGAVIHPGTGTVSGNTP